MKESEFYLLFAVIFAASHCPRDAAILIVLSFLALHSLWRFILEPRKERSRGRQ